ncbi:MAG TPA: ABC transporter substrate-binding protein [Verrucomicrobiae bacterium]|nr:ABC transporter substrate-binding protein [Verrucomicrobiae bacterium]
MFKKSLAWVITAFLAVGLLAGCGTSNQNAAKNEANKSVQSAYPMTIKDDTQTDVTISAQPKRIVSLVPSSTETLFALGLEGKVVAVTKWDDYPVDVQKKVEYVFADSLNPNTEQILKLNPDLIILGALNAKTVETIRNLKIPVVVLKPENLQSTYKSIETLGQLTGTADEAKKIVTEMQNKEKNIAQKVGQVKEADRLRVWTEVDANLFTPGDGTFLNELITKAGGTNIASDVKGWAQYNSEKVIAKNPQVIFETYSYYDKDAKKNILARQGWQSLDAVKNQRVVELNSNLVTRPGPRIVDGLESIAKALYPDLFK